MNKKPKNKLATAGDICQTCRSQWEHQGMEPMRFQPVLDAKGQPTFTDKGIPIVACSFCDSELIFKLPKVTVND